MGIFTDYLFEVGCDIFKKGDHMQYVQDDLLLKDEVLEENQITQVVIDNLQKPYFYLISDESVIEYIFEYCKNLLTYSMNKHGSKEIAYAINLNTLKFEGAEMGNSRTVDITHLVEKIDDSECVFIVLHNHPSNNPFSPKDIETFMNAQNMLILMVLGNKGAMYIIEKSNDIVEYTEKLLLRRTLIDYRIGKISFSNVISNLETLGIKYTCI